MDCIFCDDTGIRKFTKVTVKDGKAYKEKVERKCEKCGGGEIGY